ncbi:hypothetical protein ABZP36_018398 [Zizania latifolia]
MLFTTDWLTFPVPEREEKKIDCLWCCFLCKNRTQAAADGPHSCHIGCRMHRTWASVPTEHGHHRLMLKLRLAAAKL